jgi:hypothetical protein
MLRSPKNRRSGKLRRKLQPRENPRGNYFAMAGRGDTACQKPILPDNKTMSAQQILIEEIRRQPELVVREVLHYLKFLERQRAQEDWADVLPSREVEQEKLDLLDGK